MDLNIHPPEATPLVSFPLTLTRATFAIATGARRWWREQVPVVATVTVADAPILRNGEVAAKPWSMVSGNLDARKLAVENILRDRRS